jgi:hypothetical protein
MKIHKYFLPLLILICIIILSGCTKEVPVSSNDNTQKQKDINSCEGCHTNYQVLKAVASPDTVVVSGGCGGDAPHYEPYDRVYLGGAGYDHFKNSVHGKLDCVTCHNGIGNTDDKKLAHSGDFIRHPSKNAEEKCGGCHPNIVSRTKNSLHEQGWGQKRMVVARTGVGSFSNLTEMMKNGYTENCGKCHATCGDCHINRPVAGGGGLFKGHQFSRTPDMRENCIACHSSRGGHAYFGVATGSKPDVHLTKAGFSCIDCHTKNEIHGDGRTYDHRYQMTSLPKCASCHSGIQYKNNYHKAHYNTFSCNTCHSQDYNNCGSCHIGGEGARIHSYQAYKIGMNPITDVKPYKFATLRRSLSAPDSWINYGTPMLINFDAFPTYNYSTPHNIQRWTSRTQTGEGLPCYYACHIIPEGNELRNKELYLFESDLLEWEVNASRKITVDGKLPANWGL